MMIYAQTRGVFGTDGKLENRIGKMGAPNCLCLIVSNPLKSPSFSLGKLFLSKFYQLESPSIYKTFCRGDSQQESASEGEGLAKECPRQTDTGHH